jgi:hypothetical protein
MEARHRGAIVLLGLLATVALGSFRASAGEETFIFVDRMPAVRGELVRTIEGRDSPGGHQIEQTLYAEDFEHAVIETYVLKVTCGTDMTPKTYITAIKYPPKKPATFTVATLHDIYKEVYVEDPSGKIRLYEDVQSQQMLTLSDRFKPACLPT